MENLQFATFIPNWYENHDFEKIVVNDVCLLKLSIKRLENLYKKSGP